MKIDAYIKLMLTIIAVCLVALTLSTGSRAGVRAAAGTHCRGVMKATAATADQAALGASYAIDVRCE